MAARRPTPVDLEIASKYALREKIVDALKVPFWLAVSWVPLQPISDIVEDLAGKETSVSMNFVASATATWGLVSSIGWAQSASKSRRRRNRLEAGRVRTDSLETRLMEKDKQE